MRPSCLILALIAVSIGGCAVGSDRIVRTNPGALTLDAAGSLSAAPAPLTLARVAKAPAGSATRAFLQFWFYGQWGAASLAARAYSPAILGVAPLKVVAAALDFNRVGAVSQTPTVTDVPVPGKDVLLTVELRSTSAPEYESFLMRRIRGQWRIAYDSVLERVLPAYVTQQRQDAIDPKATTPSPAARAAGLRLLDRLHSVALTRHY